MSSKKSFVEDRLEALNEKPLRQKHKLSGRDKAMLTAIACSNLKDMEDGL